MAKKKSAVFNQELKTFFEIQKRKNNVTSKQIAEALGVSQQTVTSMSGKLDQLSIIDLSVIAATLNTDMKRFFFNILMLSKISNQCTSLDGPFECSDLESCNED